MGPWKHVCWADANPGPRAGVDTWWPCTPEGFAAMDYDSSTTLDSFIAAQKNWTLYSGCCRFILGFVAIVYIHFSLWCGKVYWKNLVCKDLERSGSKGRDKVIQWMLAIIWISMECLSWDFLNRCEFFCLKSSRRISSILVQLKKMFIFEVRDEQVEESDFFSASPEPYCNRKCKVIESVVMIQSQKITG